jgi:hypothetical protein
MFPYESGRNYQILFIFPLQRALERQQQRINIILRSDDDDNDERGVEKGAGILFPIAIKCKAVERQSKLLLPLCVLEIVICCGVNEESMCVCSERKVETRDTKKATKHCT